MAFENIDTAGYIKMISGNGPANRVPTQPGAILKITFQDSLNKHKDPLGLRRPRGMQPMCNPHKPTQHCLLICSGTTPWHWKIMQRRHIQQNIGCAVDQENCGAINSSHHPHLKASDGTTRECLSQKTGHRSPNAGAPANHGHSSANIGAPSNQNPLRDWNI